LATYRGSDTDPREVFVWHSAGLDGGGGSSYIDSIVLRQDDTTTAWTAAPDTLNRRVYPMQNWRADVVAMYDLNEGIIAERVKYSAYGVPFCIAAADFDGDGDVDAADNTAYSNANTAGDPSADLNLDGVVDFNDTLAWNNLYSAAETGGRSVLSRASVRNRIGYAGYQHDPSISGSAQASGQGKYHVRHRVYDAGVGRWTKRDQAGYIGGISLVAYCSSDPMGLIDSEGLTPSPPRVTPSVLNAHNNKIFRDPPQPGEEGGVELTPICDDERLDIEFVDGSIRSWLDYLCADSVTDQCVGKLSCIVSAVSCVESRHGAGAGKSASRDPMQVGDLRNPAWATITAGAYNIRPRRRDPCPGVGWPEISVNSDMHGAIDRELGSRDRERFCPRPPRRLPTQGNLSSRWTSEMSYFWGIGWVIYQHQLVNGGGGAWSICSANLSNAAWIDLAIAYNGGGDPEYGRKIRAYLHSSKNGICKGLVQ
jgi:RHS repeat-associated protein